jgi:hypothetical protein
MHMALSPAAMLDSIRPRVSGLTHDARMLQKGDWKIGGLRFLYESAPIVLIGRLVPGDQHYLWDRADWEEELRSLDGPNCERVIQFLRQTQQTITITPMPCILGSTKLARICEQICGHAARATEGLIHVYQEGFFDAEGESLFPYCAKHRLRTT